jgi:hypothetical protein
MHCFRLRGTPFLIIPTCLQRRWLFGFADLRACAGTNQASILARGMQKPNGILARPGNWNDFSGSCRRLVIHWRPTPGIRSFERRPSAGWSFLYARMSPAWIRRSILFLPTRKSLPGLLVTRNPGRSVRDARQSPGHPRTENRRASGFPDARCKILAAR